MPFSLNPKPPASEVLTSGSRKQRSTELADVDQPAPTHQPAGGAWFQLNPAQGWMMASAAPKTSPASGDLFVMRFKTHFGGPPDDTYPRPYSCRSGDAHDITGLAKILRLVEWWEGPDRADLTRKGPDRSDLRTKSKSWAQALESVRLTPEFLGLLLENTFC